MRGNPLVLVAMFFGAAVLLMGGLYALAPVVLGGPTLLSVATMGALALSLGFCLLVIGRIFWVVSKATNRARASRSIPRK